MKTKTSKTLKKGFIAVAILLSFGVNKSFSQLQNFDINFGVTGDTICAGGLVSMTAHLDTINIIPQLAFPVGVTLDDGFSSVIPLPFPFTFYGTVYNSVIFSSNNVVSFNIANAGAFCPWAIPVTPLPFIGSPPQLWNCIMGPWQDTYINNPGGTCRYATQGVAPNRIFFVEFINLPMFSCTTDGCFTDQIQLYENGNIVETHIQSKTLCPTWNGGNATHGLQDATGTLADIVPGRNGTQWTANHEGTRFTPNGPGAYTITTIPFAPILTYSSSSITWYANTVAVGYGPSLNVSPLVTTDYYAYIQYGIGQSCDPDSLIPINIAGPFTVTVAPSYLLNSAVILPATNTNGFGVSCNGDLTGSASIAAAGGLSPFTYSWNTVPVQNNDTAVNLGAGTYVVSVTDAGGCTVTASVTITQPPLLTATAPVVVGVSCNGASNGSVSESPSGGTGAGTYSYVWTSASGIVGTTQTVNGLPGGSYHVVVTDANGCTTSANAFVLQPSAITAIIPPPTNITCFGINNGAATVNAAGGTGAGTYSYVWTNSASTVVGTTASITGLAADTYTVTVTDANGCVQTATTTINPAVAVSANITSQIDVTCNGGSDGSLTAVPGGGTPGYTYSWTNSASTVVGNTAVVAGLSAGAYTVTITDANGCVQTASATITQLAQVTATIDLPSLTSVSCNGGNNGSATVNPGGGTGTYSYVWTNTASAVVGNGATASNLPIDTYTVTVTDGNGCVQTATAVITQPTPLVAPINGQTDVSCNGGSDGTASVNPNGGTGLYNYVWTSVSSGNVVGTNINAIGLAADNYTVLVTDANGCTALQNVTVNQPTQVTVSVSPDSTICNGQSTSISAIGNGGTPGYIYSWSNSVNGASQVVTPPTGANVYSVIATDLNGCQSLSSSLTVTVNPVLNVSALGTPSICIGSTASISSLAGGGNGGPYTYSWNNGSILGQNATVAPDHDSTFTVELNDGCSPPVQASVTIIVNALPVADFLPLTASGCPPFNVAFTDGSITPSGSQFDWNFGDGFSSPSQNPSHVYSQTGIYNVSLIVRTPQGCADTLQQPNVVTVLEVPAAMFAMSDEQISMYNAVVSFTDLSSGAISQSWNFGDGIGTSDSLNPVYQYTAAGTYTIQLLVENSAGCFDSTQSVIQVNNEITLYAPTGFTPNGDGVNDYFQAYGIGITDYSIWVYDRWGSLAFHSNNKNVAWNGKTNNSGELCPSDVYVYKIQYTDVDGKAHDYVGHVTITR